MSLILVTGGVRSGKSQFAEELAHELQGSVLYVATGKAWDEEMRQRITLHQHRRPSDWGLVEIQADLAEIFPRAYQYQAVLIDCLSNWISNRILPLPEEKIRNQEIHLSILTSLQQWAQAITEDERTYIVVTNEVGLGGIALTTLGRWFADLVGDANQLLAKQAEQVYVVIAGIPRRIKG